MPQAVFTAVLSVSGELLPEAGASNLLKPGAYTKWLCPKGSAQASVVLQLASSCRIESVDVGNCGSAFVELLVGSAEHADNYQVLVPASSLMSVQESRRFEAADGGGGAEARRVRMFGSEQLSAGAKVANWDRVKIVCTQPFNKSVPYGLSFVTMVVTPVGVAAAKQHETSAAEKPAVKAAETIGGVKLREFDESASGPGSQSVMFAKRASLRTEEGGNKTGGSGSAVQPRAEGAVTDAKQKTAPAPAAQPAAHKQARAEAKGTPAEPSEAPKQREKPADDAASGSKQPPAKEGQPKDGGKATKGGHIPFAQLMSNVTFSLSGFENPYRAELRNKCMAMGAVYAPNWQRGKCTHLICAFKNTPKHKQVRGEGGRVVGKEWVERCHRMKTRFSWRKFALDSGDETGRYSDEETAAADVAAQPRRRAAADAQRHMAEAARGDDDGGEQPSDDRSPPSAKRRRGGRKSDADADYEGSEGTGKTESCGESESSSAASGSGDRDTDEEVEHIRRKQAKKRADGNAKDGDRPGTLSAANGASSKQPPQATGGHPAAAGPPLQRGADGLPVLPDFFDACVFYIYGKMEADERRKLARHIYAYGGDLRQYMGADVTHVLTTEEQCNEEMQQSRADYAGQQFIFVKPKWVEECVKAKAKVGVAEYLVEGKCCFRS